MTSGQAHVPSEWSREAMTSAPYQVTSYEAAPASYPAIPNVAPAPVQYAPQPQYQMATYGDRAPLAPYPNQNLSPTPAPNVLAQPDQNNKNIFKKIMIGSAVIAAASVAAGAIGIGVYLNRDSKIDSTPNDGADRNASAPAIAGPETNGTLTLDQATPTEFFDDANFTDKQRVDWAYDKLNTPSSDPEYEGKTVLEAAHAKLASILNKPGEHSYIGELVKPSLDMSGDEVSTLFSSISFLAGTSDLPEDVRIKLLAAEVDASNPALGNLIEYVKQRDINHLQGAHEVRIDADTGAKMESPIFRHYIPENGYNPAGIPSKIISVLDTTSGRAERSQNIIQFISGKPVLVESYSTSDEQKRVTYPERIPANS